MKRSRAFILAEQLLTIMLQAGFILVLCGSFYQLTSFYANINRVLTARNHAERVISFFDDKIRHAGLGLWQCNNSEEVNAAIRPFTDRNKLLEDFRLPVALMIDHTTTTPQYLDDDKTVQYGSVLTLLYGARHVSTSDSEPITIVTQSSGEDYPREISDAKISASNRKYKNILLLLDGSTPGILSDNNGYVRSLFEIDKTTDKEEQETERYRMNRYAVTEGTGYPMYMHDLPKTGTDKGHITAYTYNKAVTVNNASELIPLKCMKMYIHDANDGLGRQFTFSETEPIEDNAKWGNRYHQEIGILEIYMTLDTTNKLFTLYVLASGGYDEGVSNPRPETWPKEANPAGEGATDAAKEADAKAKWLTHEYSHHIVYVSRASWKLNNLEGFSWN